MSQQQQHHHHHRHLKPDVNTPHLRGKERKSRRTHKNSRDEELPACHNCIKKNYHCGYLDYSEEKLEKLRKKNQDKHQPDDGNQRRGKTLDAHIIDAPENEFKHGDSNNTRQLPPGASVDRHRPFQQLPRPHDALNSHFRNPVGAAMFASNGSNKIELAHTLEAGSLPGGFSNAYHNSESLLNPNSAKLVNGTNFVITPPFADQNMSLDSSPYSDSPNNVDQLFSSYFPTFIANQPVSSITPPNIFEYVVDSDYDYFNKLPLGNEDFNLAVFTDSIRKLSQLHTDVLVPAEYTENHVNVDLAQMSQMNLLRQLADPDAVNFDLLAGSDTQSVENCEKYQPINAQHNDTTSSQTAKEMVSDLAVESKPVTGEPLPNGQVSNASFKVLKHPDNIRSLFTRKVSQFLPDPSQYTLSLHEPDWTRKNNEDLWTITLGEAFVRILTKKSYAYFGRIIRNLRTAVTEVDVQITTIGSWYAGWSSLLQKRASAKATTLFYGGSASLLWNCLNNCQHFGDLDPRLRFITNAVRNHTSCAVIPDYKINVIFNIHENFVMFKKFVNYNLNLTSAANGYILKYLLDTEKFLEYLLEDLHPRFIYIDQFYREKNSNDKDSLGIRYFSPSLFYELINRWLRLIPSHARSIGREMSPLKRTFYLFYIAIAKALANVFPLIRSAFLTDTWDTLYPQVDFDYHLFNFSRNEVPDEAQYNFLSNCTSKLLRVIKFFNTRQQIISHVLSADTVLEPGKSFINSVEPQHDETREPMRDIAFMTPEKRDFGEVMLNNFTINTIVNIYNYPKLVDFSSNLCKGTKLRKIIERENHNQKVRIEEYRAKYKETDNTDASNKEHLTNVNHAYDFDFDRGMFWFDYAVEPILEHLLEYLDNLPAKENLSIEELKGQILDFETSHKNMFHSIDQNDTN
ncbi:hypothetical protein CANMA_001389 [Candida margitis]|uniref:uncharacterized protein n=1 Tax=Candida margitis TaxID=1775924 RepID=UPI0022263836|nr:uncharacterized protein CANMA_001389 [Candida margitis]KAI5969539.1 hypothetical protein CANMA_001389 [Candida margitis]